MAPSNQIQEPNNQGNEGWASLSMGSTLGDKVDDIESGVTDDGTGAVLVPQPEKEKELSTPELLFSDVMGIDVVQVYVGKDQQQFTVHANLLFDAGKFFKVVYSLLQPGQKIILGTEQPFVFKFFIDYLYTKAIPTVRAGMDQVAMAIRLKGLCQLAAFAEKFDLTPDIRNKTLDAIQDGFAISNRVPEAGLVESIFEHTISGSKIRKFCIASLLFYLRSDNYKDDGSLPSVINANDDIMDDFLAAVRNLTSEKDPRIRDCQGKQGCVECARGNRCEKLGYESCAFHIHLTAEVKVEEENTPATSLIGTGQDDKTRENERCYLWLA